MVYTALLTTQSTVCLLINWCFELSQPIGKAEIRPEEQSQKTESCRENWWDEIQLKGPHKQKQTQEQREKEGGKRLGKLGWFISDIDRNIPTT